MRAFPELRDEHYTMLVGRNLAWIYYELGERDRGRVLHEENLRRARALGNRRVEASTLQGLAWRAADEGRWREALALLGESYPISREIGDRAGVADDLYRLARALLVARRPAAAATLLSRADALSQ